MNDDIYVKTKEHFDRIASNSRQYLLTDWDHREIREVDWVSGSCLIARRAAIDEIGGLDEGFFMYAEDVDFCWRANNKNFNVGWTDSTSIVHIGGASSKKPKYKQWLGEFKGLIYLFRVKA